MDFSDCQLMPSMYVCRNNIDDHGGDHLTFPEEAFDFDLNNLEKISFEDRLNTIPNYVSPCHQHCQMKHCGNTNNSNYTNFVSNPYFNFCDSDIPKECSQCMGGCKIDPTLGVNVYQVMNGLESECNEWNNCPRRMNMSTIHSFPHYNMTNPNQYSWMNAGCCSNSDTNSWSSSETSVPFCRSPLSVKSNNSPISNNVHLLQTNANNSMTMHATVQQSHIAIGTTNERKTESVLSKDKKESDNKRKSVRTKKVNPHKIPVPRSRNRNELTFSGWYIADDMANVRSKTSWIPNSNPNSKAKGFQRGGVRSEFEEMRSESLVTDFNSKPPPHSAAYARIRVWKDSSNRKYYDCLCDCRKPVQDLTKIKRHALSHDQKNFQCDVCGRIFHSNHLQLNAHKKTHKKIHRKRSRQEMEQ